jgi:N-acetylmuramoyl-L-alanine amidase
MNASAWAEFKERLKESDTVQVYKTIKDIPSWALPTVNKLIAHGSLKGDANGELNLDRNMLRLLVINDREGLYGK